MPTFYPDQPAADYLSALNAFIGGGATIGGTLVGATAGRILYAGAGPVLADSANLTFVSATGILSATGFAGALNGTVGATTPAAGAFTTLDASGRITSTVTSANVFLAQSATTAHIAMQFQNTSGLLIIGIESSAGGAITSGSTAYYSQVRFGSGKGFQVGDGAAVFTTTSATGLAVTGTLSSTGILSTTDATDATSATAASLKTAGGIASVKSAWIGANLIVAGAGPHAIGVATSTNIQLYQGGTFTGVTDVLGWYMAPTLIPAINCSALGIRVQPTFNKAGSGTHVEFISLEVAPAIINAGAATLTDSTTLKITNAPSVGTNLRALWVAAGTSQFSGAVAIDGSTTGAQTATFVSTNKPGAGTTSPDLWVPITLAGVVHYIPAFL